MSGGEQQMVAIGRALMAKPRVLLLDEPSMGLAPILVQQIFDIIKEINDRGTTVLLVEQNAQQALQLAHRAYVLETGRVVKSADASLLLDDPQVRAAYLGGDLDVGGRDGLTAGSGSQVPPGSIGMSTPVASLKSASDGPPKACRARGATSARDVVVEVELQTVTRRRCRSVPAAA